MRPNGIDIPEGVNLYEEYKRVKQCAVMIETLNEVFKERDIDESEWPELGNVVLRFSHMMGEQDEPVQLPPLPDRDDPSDEADHLRLIHFVADLYEDYYAKVEPKLEGVDTDFSFVAQQGKARVAPPPTVPLEPDTLGRSALQGFQYELVGFCHAPHPQQGRLQFTFFRQMGSDLYVLCMSDVSRNQAKAFAKTLKGQLGKIVDGDEVAPYAQRSLDGLNYDSFKELMRDGIETTFNVKIAWK